MRNPRPSLAHRAAWLFPPAAILLFVLVIRDWRAIDWRSPEAAMGALAVVIYYLALAWSMTRRALTRTSL